MKTKRKILKNAFIVLLCLAVVGIATLFIVNGHVKSVGKDRILSVEKAAELEDVDCIIVLGCQVKDDGSLSHMLRDRLMCALEVYEVGAAPKLLMSGDHGREDYDEVGAMKNYAIENGVPSENVFMDHAGFSTYETVYRAKEIFEADKVIIVTQEYHLYRALYIAEQLGMELVIQDMEFEAVVTSVGKNGVDVAMAGLTVNETRKKSVNFTESYYNAAQMLVVMEDEDACDACKTADDVLAALKK